MRARPDRPSPTPGCVSDAVDRRVHRRLLKLEILRVQIRNIEILKPDRASAMPGEVDHGGVPVNGDIQILEAGNTGDRGEIDQIFPVGEVTDNVISVIETLPKASPPVPPDIVSLPLPPQNKSSPAPPKS